MRHFSARRLQCVIHGRHFPKESRGRLGPTQNTPRVRDPDSVRNHAFVVVVTSTIAATVVVVAAGVTATGPSSVSRGAILIVVIRQGRRDLQAKCGRQFQCVFGG